MSVEILALGFATFYICSELGKKLGKTIKEYRKENA